MIAKIEIEYLGEGVYFARVNTPLANTPFPNKVWKGDIDFVVGKIGEQLKQEAELCPTTGS